MCIIFDNIDADLTEIWKGNIMDIGLILKIAGVGLIVSLATQILNKSGRDEQGLMIVIAGLIVVFFMLVGEMDDLISRIKDVFEI